ncbi:putative transcriptional regulatory protein [Nocardioides baekrokdamisoli]|uniref:Probable transcriptional regulatory protein Back2_06240 n=1 Tax=Nocardioides baekrokdamisoli TaxID=1804624 RepID=A0A3G9IBT9_9ACTN|nr:YebC/PmpR family DNA-binding transcriptional regulator [Nocardioides baekrokdamisoli]BBH16337.1 putative transcriptional regulatory protein [Nocardioides baekrokdamisoli]
MSGHSKWATTKHKKAAIDQKRAKSFAKLIKVIEVAAKAGGADTSGNPALYEAIQKAKKQSVPNDNIDRAVKRGAGIGGEAVSYDTIMYEVYGPSGIALLVECLTDNKNRAAMEVRTAVTRNGGTMADPGSVSRLFNRKGVVVLNKAQGGKDVDEDAVLEATLDAGAEDVNDLGDTWQVISEATDVIAVRQAVEEAGLDYESAESEFIASMDIPVGDVPTAEKVMRLVDVLDDLDDVQNVFTNADITDEVLAEMSDED